MASFENSVVVAKNVNFDIDAPKPHLGVIDAPGKLPIGTGQSYPVAEILGGELTSPDGSILIGYSSPNITLEASTSTGGVIRGPDVDFTAVGTTNLYTFTQDFVVTALMFVNTQLTGALNQASNANVGWTAASYDDIVGGLIAFPTELTNEKGLFLPATIDDFPIIPAGETLVFNLTSAETGASVYVNRIDILGYYFAGNGPTPPTLPITYTANDGGTATPALDNVNIFARSGSTTIASSSTLTVLSPAYADASASATSAKNTGEFVTGAYTRTLPASAGLADGDLIEYVCTSASALVIQSVGAQQIRLGNTLSGVAGSATSTAIGDSISLRFRATDGFWYATASIGNWTISP